MTLDPMHSFEQPAGFPFDSMDFAMSRSASCLDQVHSNLPRMDDWEDDAEDENRKEESNELVVEVEIDHDLEDEEGLEKEGQGFGKDTDGFDDGDDEFEQYLHGDDGD